MSPYYRVKAIKGFEPGIFVDRCSHFSRSSTWRVENGEELNDDQW